MAGVVQEGFRQPSAGRAHRAGAVAAPSLWVMPRPSLPPHTHSHPAGWISGSFQVPPSCSGVSASACSACLATADAPGCLACSNETAGDAATTVLRGEPDL